MDNEYKKHREAFDFFSEKFHPKKQTSGSKKKSATEPWRKLEAWARDHPDPEMRKLAARAFDVHDVRAMNDLVCEYDWFLDRMEKDISAS